MATSIHPFLSCLLPFYTIPIVPLLNRKIFHLLVYVDVMLILMDCTCMCVPTFVIGTQLAVYLHTQTALYYNVWPEAIFISKLEVNG